MIRFRRPNSTKGLRSKAANATKILWDAWKLAPGNIQIVQSVYGGNAVKSKFRKAQHDKCVYCETKLVRDYGQVEHYRPKEGWKQSQVDSLQKPGYFWLAYEWRNLCVSCAMCNDAGHKANLFPLEVPTNRATAARPSLILELPLLLNAFDDFPEDHIGWNRDIPFAKSGSIRGMTTIEVFHLDADEHLIDARRDHFAKIRAILETVETEFLANRLRNKLVAILKKSIADHAPYAAMIRCSFRARILSL